MLPPVFMRCLLTQCEQQPSSSSPSNRQIVVLKWHFSGIRWKMLPSAPPVIRGRFQVKAALQWGCTVLWRHQIIKNFYWFQLSVYCVRESVEVKVVFKPSSLSHCTSVHWNDSSIGLFVLQWWIQILYHLDDITDGTNMHHNPVL